MSLSSITGWTRLEPRARSADMKQSLQAQVRDPVWILTRQWQIGEFSGHDAGSPAQVHASLAWKLLTDYRPTVLGGPAVAYDRSLPLEAHVEREAVVLGLRFAVQLGLQVEAMLTAAGLTANISLYRNAYAVDATPADVDLHDIASERFRRMAAGRVTNGQLLYESAVDFLAGRPPKTPPPNGGDPAVQGVLQAFVTYRQSLFTEPDHDDAWREDGLEYQFSIGSRGPETDVLDANDFRGGRLDWYSFSVGTDALDSNQQPQAGVVDLLLLPVHVTFSGMPTQRWWEFEDSQIDFGQLDTDHTDLTKMVVAEFALVYGNDWYELPIELPVGSLSRVSQLIVTDTFGVRTLVNSASSQAPPIERQWRMFTIEGPQQDADFMLLAPTVNFVVDGDDLEEVLFIRDDMADMAWAIQKKIQGPLDAGVDGYESYRQRIAKNPPPDPPTAQPNGPEIFYLVGTTVPDPWVPFVPVKGIDGSLLLRRGVMDHPEAPNLITVRADLLEPGKPLFLRDHVIPRAGVKATRYFRRTRWTDGSTFTWLARKTGPGRGEGYSGLAFDLIQRLTGPPGP
jgi:hypothetical protein